MLGACHGQAQKLIAVQRTRLAVARQLVWFFYSGRAEPAGLSRPGLRVDSERYPAYFTVTREGQGSRGDRGCSSSRQGLEAATPPEARLCVPSRLFVKWRGAPGTQFLCPPLVGSFYPHIIIVWRPNCQRYSIN